MNENNNRSSCIYDDLSFFFIIEKINRKNSLNQTKADQHIGNITLFLLKICVHNPKTNRSPYKISTQSQPIAYQSPFTGCHAIWTAVRTASVTVPAELPSVCARSAERAAAARRVSTAQDACNCAKSIYIAEFACVHNPSNTISPHAVCPIIRFRIHWH